MNETPGERLAELIFQQAQGEDGMGHLRCGLENAVFGFQMRGPQSGAIDKLARAFLASYGVEVPE